MSQPIPRHNAGRTERKTDRLDAIAGGLRERIVRGLWAPGERLPNRVDIEQSFAASSVTVQIALDRLKQEGFIVASRRSGTYVAENPPHLSHIALVFPCHPRELEWNRFWTAICEEAKKIEGEGTRRFPAYYGVNGHEDAEDYHGLIRAQEQGRLAGAIYAISPGGLLHTPLFGESPLPAVTVGHNPPVPWMPFVTPHIENFVDRSVEYLASRGCKRIAVLRTVNAGTDFDEPIRRCGLETRPWWIQDISLWQPCTAEGVAQLLMHPHQTERPDGLIIADDNLLEPASKGLALVGVPQTSPLEVVAHCNFPWATPSFIPVYRIGYDITRLVRNCVTLVEAQLRGEPHQIHNLQTAVTETEWKSGLV